MHSAYDPTWLDPDWLPEIPGGLPPLAPRPTGPGSADDLVGREQEMARLHSAVLRGGAHVTGQRRMGKTWLIQRLKAELTEPTAIYISAETSKLNVFEDRMLEQLRTNKALHRDFARWEKKGKIRIKIGVTGFELELGGEMTEPANAVQNHDVLDLVRPANGRPIVLIIDEITNLCQALGPTDAAEFLRTLRARREADGLQLVISGSIGIHHALTDLSPLTGLDEIKVGPLATPDAVVLTARLLLGIGTEPQPTLVADIVRQTCAIPYYIQRTVDQWQWHQDKSVDEIIDQCLTTNLWDTDHYKTRLPDYYGTEGARQVEAILDLVAFNPEWTSIDAIAARLAVDMPDAVIQRRELITLLTNLVKDGYLVREGTSVAMSSPLLARIWRGFGWHE